ncbi:unnamed protein product [Hymenolepis diminuta]|uniref:Protein kinase domain-containing protein n=1 Tax=Hymenolepis diminuta TaxID=6216 RepID=A0A0R3S925_HYMDI|nr:unnamed protein product [Hymenolepis diminuta]
MAEDNYALTPVKNIVGDPNSNGDVENLLDVVAALVWDCNFQSAKNSRAIQSFVQRFSELANIIYAQRTKYTDFEMVKVIGQGGFGRVQLVRHKDTRRVYAMKMMSKQHLLDHSQSGYWEERDIMVKGKSEWLVTCHQAFVVSHRVFKDCLLFQKLFFYIFMGFLFSQLEFFPLVVPVLY